MDVYEQVSRLYAGKGNYQQSLAFYEQALRLFPACARLHEKRAEVE
ncbi:tetratricopeptide repeat protein [Reticulibacter mediterranei]